MNNPPKNYWNNKHHLEHYSYTDISISDVLLNYINSLNNINTFLDHGCGHGRVSKIVCDKFPNIDITINDIIPIAIDKSKELLKRKELHTVIGKIHHISGKYDCIISHRVIHSCPNYKHIFGEISRLLDKEGSCFISVRSIDCIQKETHKEWFDSNTNTIYKPETGRFTKLFEVNEFQELLSNRGLNIIKSGNFTELSAKSKKNNQYLYAICSHQ